MKKIKERGIALVLTVLMVLFTVPNIAFAANNPPSEIKNCESNFGYDFKIKFNDTDKEWLEAIDEIIIANENYSKGTSSYSVWNNKYYYIDKDNQYLHIGEGGAFVDNKARCVIKANGYEDLVLELDKSNHTAIISKDSSEEDEKCKHSGGIATCIEQATCEKCGKKYGELGPHNYINGVCTVCGDTLTAAPEVSLESESYYLVFKIKEKGYVSGISSISENDTEWKEQSFKMALNGKQYYLDKENDCIYFDKFNGIPFETGGIITIKNEAYQDIKLKVNVVNDKDVNIIPVTDDVEVGDEYRLHVRLVGNFEAAIINQKGYDAVTSASTSVTQNKNSSAEVQAVILPKDKEPTEEDWKPLCDSNISLNTAKDKTFVTLDDQSGMVGVYSPYDSSVTLSGTPEKKGEYPITVTITDNQGRRATSNALIFKVYSGEENLEDQLTTENCTQTADGKYMYDMEPWAIKNFDNDDNIVYVPKNIKAWYGSHTSGTYGKLGYSIPSASKTTQTLVVPKGCDLTLVNMDVLSSVRIVVENGGKLSLHDTPIQGIVEVKKGGTFSMNYNDFGDGEFLTGSSINGQLILQDGATVVNSIIYSNTNYIANGDETRSNINPVVVANGNVNVIGTVVIRGDESPMGINATTGKANPGQTGLKVNGKLNITEGSYLAVYGGGHLALTTNGGTAIVLNNGEITGKGKLIAVAGDGTFGYGGNAVEGKGIISVKDAYLEGGAAIKPMKNEVGGSAITEGIKIADTTNRNLINGETNTTGNVDYDNDTYWGSVADPLPSFDGADSKYQVEKNGVTNIKKEYTLTLSPENTSIYVGDVFNITYSINPIDATNQGVIYSSSDESIATVDNNGIVTAIAEGNVVIKVTTVDGTHSAVCNVTVAHKHVYSDEWKWDTNNHYHICTCGDIADSETHVFGDWTVIQEATIEEDGINERICTVCGFVERTTTKYTIIPDSNKVLDVDNNKNNNDKINKVNNIKVNDNNIVNKSSKNEKDSNKVIKESNAIKTGDNNYYIVYGVMMILSITLYAVYLNKRKKLS